MGEFFNGLLVLGGLVLFQVLARALRTAQVNRWCKNAEEAIAAQDWALAEKLIDRCLRRIPLWVEGRRSRAILLARTGRLEEAEAEFKLAAELRPRDANGYAQLAFFYAELGPEKAEQTVEALRIALQCDPSLIDTLLMEPCFDHVRAQAVS